MKTCNFSVAHILHTLDYQQSEDIAMKKTPLLITLLVSGALLAGFAHLPHETYTPESQYVRGTLQSAAYTRIPLANMEKSAGVLGPRVSASLKSTHNSTPVLAEKTPDLSASFFLLGEENVIFLSDFGPQGVNALMPASIIEDITEMEFAFTKPALSTSEKADIFCSAPRLTFPDPRIMALSMPARVQHYKDTVHTYAQKYKLDTALVLAIVQTESGFNPGLVSSRDAHGLMQIVPATAGGEVHRWFGQQGLPSAKDLLSPEYNIRYGTTYLHLLRTRHLDGIADAKSLEYCMVASYNGGSGAVLRFFGATKDEAITAINGMSSQEVYMALSTRFPSAETRAFVGKVMGLKDFYRASLGESVHLEANSTPQNPPSVY